MSHLRVCVRVLSVDVELFVKRRRKGERDAECIYVCACVYIHIGVCVCVCVCVCVQSMEDGGKVQTEPVAKKKKNGLFASMGR